MHKEPDRVPHQTFYPEHFGAYHILVELRVNISAPFKTLSTTGMIFFLLTNKNYKLPYLGKNVGEKCATVNHRDISQYRLRFGFSLLYTDRVPFELLDSAALL
jgi:hypothetical protein